MRRRNRARDRAPAVTGRLPSHSRWRATVRALDARLADVYGTPEQELANLSDPLDEAIYMVLSAQTDVPRARAAWASLRAAFPSWRGVEVAPERAVAAVLRPGGLQRQKARKVKRLLADVRRRFGRLSLDGLRELEDGAAEAAILLLPGMSWKSARCVMLYALDRQAFPVDVNTFRVLKRIGVLNETQVYRRKSLHDALQGLVPPALRRRLHVNLVIHGQKVCRPTSPRCGECPVRRLCKMGRTSVSRHA